MTKRRGWSYIKVWVHPQGGCKARRLCLCSRLASSAKSSSVTSLNHSCNHARVAYHWRAGPAQGSYYVRQGVKDYYETWGLLAHWASQIFEAASTVMSMKTNWRDGGPAQGNYYVRQGVKDYNETWGLLTNDWGAVRSPALASELRQLQPRTLGRSDLWPVAPASSSVRTK